MNLKTGSTDTGNSDVTYYFSKARCARYESEVLFLHCWAAWCFALLVVSCVQYHFRFKVVYNNKNTKIEARPSAASQPAQPVGCVAYELGLSRRPSR